MNTTETQPPPEHVYTSGYRADAPMIWTNEFGWCNSVSTYELSEDGKRIVKFTHMSIAEWFAIQLDIKTPKGRTSIDPDEYVGDDADHARMLFRRSDPDTKALVARRNPGIFSDDDEDR